MRRQSDMSNKTSRLKLLSAVAILSLQHKECDKELSALSEAYNDDILEVEKEISTSIEDEKINNDLYNKQQIKLRKRFFKK